MISMTEFVITDEDRTIREQSQQRLARQEAEDEARRARTEAVAATKLQAERETLLAEVVERLFKSYRDSYRAGLPHVYGHAWNEMYVRVNGPRIYTTLGAYFNDRTDTHWPIEDHLQRLVDAVNTSYITKLVREDEEIRLGNGEGWFEPRYIHFYLWDRNDPEPQFTQPKG